MWTIAARRPALILAVCLLASLGALAGALQVEPQVDFVDTVPDHEGLAPYRAMLEELDGIRFLAIYMAHDPAHGSTSLREPAGFDALVYEQEHLSRFLHGRFPGEITHSLSVYEGMKAGNHMFLKLATAGNPPEDSYRLPDDATWDTIRDRGLENGDFDDVLAADGSSALFLVFLAQRDQAEARALTGDMAAALEDWQSPQRVTTDHQPSGLLWSAHYTDERNASDIPKWGAIALGGVAVVLLVLLRRPDHVAFAVLGLGAATLWTFGILGALGLQLSFLSLFLAPVVSGIGVDHGIHIMHRIREARATMDKREAVLHALRTTGPAVAAAGITTVAGIGVMMFVPAPLFAEIGGLAALGVGLGLLAALTLVPALRMVFPMGRPRKAGQSAPRLGRFAVAIWKRPLAALIPVVILSLVAVGAAMVGTQVESGSAENEFPQDDPVIRLQHRIEEEYGAFQRAYLIVQGDLTDPAALLAIHDATRGAFELPLYRNASSITDLLLADEATDEGAQDVLLSGLLGPTGQGPSEQERLPQSHDEARQRLDALYEDPLWSSLAPFAISRDYDLAVVAIQLDPWQDQTQLQQLRAGLQLVATRMDGELPDHDVAAGGAPMNRAAVIEQTPVDIMLVTVGSSLVVGLVLAVAWRRRRGGIAVAALAAMMPLLAAAWLLGSIPVLDWIYEATSSHNHAALNNMFLLAFAITVAVGVDDVVHLAKRFWEARDAGMARRDALHEAYATAGRAITGTTATTVVAFSLLAGVYFLQSKNLAILTALGATYAYLLAIVLTPIILAGRPTEAT